MNVTVVADVLFAISYNSITSVALLESTNGLLVQYETWKFRSV